jgi:quercetin dioxygenase-like cupin family protein
VEIKPNGTQPSSKGPAEAFSGDVRIDPLFQAPSPARVLGASVTFEPGARTAWHTHPLGQLLIVTSGCGLVQSWGGPVKRIRAGDVVWCPPGEKHWHGATPRTAMTHIAILETLDGKAVDWMEKVSDDEYRTAADSSDSVPIAGDALSSESRKVQPQSSAAKFSRKVQPQSSAVSHLKPCKQWVIELPDQDSNLGHGD